jgi:hypothetical protein
MLREPLCPLARKCVPARHGRVRVRVRVNTLILKRLTAITYCSTPHVIDTDVVQTGDDNVAAWFTGQADSKRRPDQI